MSKKCPNGCDKWISIWMWIALTAFFCGIVVGSAYYNIQCERALDTILFDETSGLIRWCPILENLKEEPAFFIIPNSSSDS